MYRITYGQMIFDKEIQTIQWKKDNFFHKWCWFNLKSTYRRRQIDPFLCPCTKFKTKWIKNFHIKPDTHTLFWSASTCLYLPNSKNKEKVIAQYIFTLNMKFNCTLLSDLSPKLLIHFFIFLKIPQIKHFIMMFSLKGSKSELSKKSIEMLLKCLHKYLSLE